MFHIESFQARIIVLINITSILRMQTTSQACSMLPHVGRDSSKGALTFALLETVRLVLEGSNGPDSDDENGVCYQPQPSSSIGEHTSSDSHLPAQINNKRPAPSSKSVPLIGGPCAHCGTMESPQWRRPLTKKVVLCNACGIYYSRHHSLPRKKKAVFSSEAHEHGDDPDTEDREPESVRTQQGGSSCSGAEESMKEDGPHHPLSVLAVGSNLRKSSLMDKRKTSDAGAEEGTDHFDDKRMAMRAAAAAAAAASAMIPPLLPFTQSLPSALPAPNRPEGTPLMEMSSLPLLSAKPQNSEASEISQIMSTNSRGGIAPMGTSYP